MRIGVLYYPGVSCLGVYYLGVPPSPTHRPALVGISARSPIGSAHGALSGWHPVELIAHVLDALRDQAAASGVELDAIDRVVLGNPTPVGALSAPLRSLAISGHWAGELDGIEVGGGRAAGHQALAHAAELVSCQAAANVIVVSAAMASVVPPGAPLLRRDYGKPLTPSTLRSLAERGGHLPDGQVADTLGFDRPHVDRQVTTSFGAAAQWPSTAASTESRIDDPDRSTPYRGPEFVVDEPLRRNAENPADFEPMFDDGGVVTALSLAQSADGVVAMLVSASTGSHELGPTMSDTGLPTDPLEPLASIAKQLIADTDSPTVVADEPSAAHTLALAQRLDIALERINPQGGAVARGRVDGAASLMGLHDVMHGSATNEIALLSSTGDGKSFGSRLTRR